MAYESLSIISTALNTIEAGKLSVCKFGEQTDLIHDGFHGDCNFDERAGGLVLRSCQCEQEKTDFAEVLENDKILYMCQFLFFINIYFIT